MKENRTHIATIAFVVLVLLCLLFHFAPIHTHPSTNDNETIPTMNNSPAETTEEEEIIEDIIVLESVSEHYIVIESDSIEELKIELNYCKEKFRLSQSILSSAIELGYKDTCDFLQVIYQDCENYLSYIEYYEQRIQELNDKKYTECLGEYPVATYIWYYMKDQGWSDYVCAGIMGNIMQETGGRTLNINYKFDGNGYYGICCWSKKYNPDVVGLDLEGQCAYLVETVEKLMNTYGRLYKNGYTFEDFLEAESIEEAANAFMVVYERPGYKKSPKRVQNGEKAYEYFVN